MNKAIKLALEKGGYKYGHGIDGDYETDGWSYRDIIDDGIQYKLILDPLFWEALGEALGWYKYCCVNCGSSKSKYSQIGESGDGWTVCVCGIDAEENDLYTQNSEDEMINDELYAWGNIPTFQFHARRYFNLLMTEQDTDKFWEELLNTTE